MMPAVVAASKLQSSYDALLEERDRLRATVSKLQKKLFDHESVLSQRIGQIRGELNSFSRFAAHVNDAALEGGGGPASATASANASAGSGRNSASR
jgi:hypothetical protein